MGTILQIARLSSSISPADISTAQEGELAYSKNTELLYIGNSDGTLKAMAGTNLFQNRSFSFGGESSNSGKDYITYDAAINKFSAKITYLNAPTAAVNYLTVNTSVTSPSVTTSALTVNGRASITSLTVTGLLTANNNKVESKVALYSPDVKTNQLSVYSGATSYFKVSSSKAQFDTQIQANKQVTISGDVVISGKTNIDGNAIFSAAIIAQSITAASTITGAGIESTSTVKATTELSGATLSVGPSSGRLLTVNPYVGSEGGLNVNTATSFNDVVKCREALTCYDTTTFESSVTCKGVVNINSALTCNSKLACVGAATFSGIITATKYKGTNNNFAFLYAKQNGEFGSINFKEHTKDGIVYFVKA